mgnify:CR=1 FL=1
MIRVVLWDIDNTLLDFPAAERQALQRSFQAFGLGPCQEAQLTRYSALNTRWWKRLENGEITKAQLLPGRFEEFFRTEGIPFTQYHEINDFYQIQLGETVVFLDHGYELVRDLKGTVKQYAVTNGTLAAQSRKLKNSGLQDLLDGVFISEQVGAEKPSPTFFHRVLTDIGPYAKDEILLVGDSLTSDMRGGRWAGLRCCWYNPQGDPVPEDPAIDYDIRDLNQVRAIVTGAVSH